MFFFCFFQAEDGIRDATVTGVQTCALPICTGFPGSADRKALSSSWWKRKGNALDGKILYIYNRLYRISSGGRMRLSKKAEYALWALIYAARHPEGTTFQIKELAERNRIPKKFLELILLELKNAGIVESRRGVGGGYLLARS